MKKLMIAAAIVCAAAMSQGASILWGGECLVDPDGNIIEDASSVPAFTLWKTSGLGQGEVGSGYFEAYDDPYNALSGEYILTVGTDKDGDTFAIKAGDAVIGTYTLSGFGDDDKSMSVPGFDVSGAVVPVPEPTSGLLLLLGVAGMALRRRRA